MSLSPSASNAASSVARQALSQSAQLNTQITQGLYNQSTQVQESDQARWDNHMQGLQQQHKQQNELMQGNHDFQTFFQQLGEENTLDYGRTLVENFLNLSQSLDSAAGQAQLATRSSQLRAVLENALSQGLDATHAQLEEIMQASSGSHLDTQEGQNAKGQMLSFSLNTDEAAWASAPANEKAAVFAGATQAQCVYSEENEDSVEDADDLVLATSASETSSVSDETAASTNTAAVSTASLAAAPVGSAETESASDESAVHSSDSNSAGSVTNMTELLTDIENYAGDPLLLITAVCFALSESLDYAMQNTAFLVEVNASSVTEVTDVSKAMNDIIAYVASDDYQTDYAYIPATYYEAGTTTSATGVSLAYAMAVHPEDFTDLLYALDMYGNLGDVTAATTYNDGTTSYTGYTNAQIYDAWIAMVDSVNSAASIIDSTGTAPLSETTSYEYSTSNVTPTNSADAILITGNNDAETAATNLQTFETEGTSMSQTLSQTASVQSQGYSAALEMGSSSIQTWYSGATSIIKNI